jgi:hypothetical protein
MVGNPAPGCAAGGFDHLYQPRFAHAGLSTEEDGLSLALLHLG